MDESDSEPPRKKRRVSPLDEEELVARMAKASRTEAWESRIPDRYVGTSARGRSPNSQTAPEEHGQVTRYRIRHRGRPVVKIPRGSPLHEPLKEKECSRLSLGNELGIVIGFVRSQTVAGPTKTIGPQGQHTVGPPDGRFLMSSHISLCCPGVALLDPAVDRVTSRVR